MGKVTSFPTKAVPNSITYPKRITIDSAKGIRTSDNVTFTDVLDLCLNAIVSNAFKVVELTVLDHQNTLAKAEAMDTAEGVAAKLDAMRKAVTEHLYDKLNAAFTYSLEVFAPDIVQHPGLSEMAVQMAEDEIINAYLEGLPEEEREAATKKAQELMAESKRALLQHIEDLNIAKEEAESLFVPLTPAQNEALKILADEEASEVDQNQAKAYLEANPLPCMIEAVEQGEVPTYEVTPTKEELDDCGEICSQCENDTCKKVTPAAKILSGLE